MKRRKVEMKKTKGLVGGIVVGIVIIFGLIIFFSCTKKVPAGYVGIIYDFKSGVTGETVGQGWRFTGPFKELILYSVGVEQSYLTSGSDGDSRNDDSFECPSSDGKGLMVDLTFTYRYDPDNITNLFTRFKGQSGKEVRDSFIKPNIISWVKEITSKYPVTEILGDGRSDLNVAISQYVHDKFEPYGIIVENVSLINIEADDDTRAAVQRKVTAQQELELAQIEQKTANVQAQKDKDVALIAAQQQKETALIQAEQEKETAIINADKAKIKAEGEANAIEIKAQAEAKANKLIAESLTNDLIEKLKYEKWNGELPRIQGASTESFINASELVAIGE